MKKTNKRLSLLVVLLVVLATLAFIVLNKNYENIPFKRNTEARDDSIKMAEALKLQDQIGNPVQAKAETTPVYSLVGEDAADDPAIWINTESPENSLIIGTDKKAGLYSYNLKGEIVQFLNAGELNNVDLRPNFIHLNKSKTIIAASNRSTNTISLFLLNPETLLISNSQLEIESSVNEVYGLCMYKDQTDRFYVFVNGKDGTIEQYEILSEDHVLVSKFCRKLQANSQPEGLVANDMTSDLFIGVEEEGIFLANASPDAGSEMEQIPMSTKSDNQLIDYDIEGLAIYQNLTDSYLIASIQGNFSYAIYDIKNTDSINYITSFTITDGPFDGAEETDGLEVSSFAINADYPEGMLVVQDGFNYQGKTLVSQNFKYIPWHEIEKYLK